MIDLDFGCPRIPFEVSSLFSEPEHISLDKLKVLLSAAQLHLQRRTDEAAALYQQVARDSENSRRLATSYSGLIRLLRAARLIPASRRHSAAVTTALQQLKAPEAWISCLVDAIITPSIPGVASSMTSSNITSVNCDVTLPYNATGNAAEQVVSMKINTDDGAATFLRFSKLEFGRFRRQMAAASDELILAAAKP